MVSLVNLDDGLVGVVFLVCLARVVFAGGVNRPHDELATQAFADDDVNVVHLTVIDRSAERLDRVDDDGVRGVVSSSVSTTACAIWSLLHPTWGSVTRVSRLVLIVKQR